MRVLMIDDHVMFLQGLKSLLSLLAPHLVVDTTDQISRAVEMVRNVPYPLVLLDWHLDTCEGAAAINRLRDGGCAAQIVVLSGDLQPKLIRQTVEFGAAGFIPKRYSSEAMLDALKVVVAGGIYLPAEALRDAGLSTRTPGGERTIVDIDHRFSQLTARQVEVYRAATRGLSNKLIARELGIAESTVKTHLSTVYGVLGVTNRTQAAYQASLEGYRVG